MLFGAALMWQMRKGGVVLFRQFGASAAAFATLMLVLADFLGGLTACNTPAFGLDHCAIRSPGAWIATLGVTDLLVGLVVSPLGWVVPLLLWQTGKKIGLVQNVTSLGC